jgi:hypothetical protein
MEGSHRTITILVETRCILLHYDSPKYCKGSLNKCISASKVVKLILNDPICLIPDIHNKTAETSS